MRRGPSVLQLCAVCVHEAEAQDQSQWMGPAHGRTTLRGRSGTAAAHLALLRLLHFIVLFPQLVVVCLYPLDATASHGVALHCVPGQHTCAAPHPFGQLQEQQWAGGLSPSGRSGTHLAAFPFLSSTSSLRAIPS